jgi:hypothetical protein
LIGGTFTVELSAAPAQFVNLAISPMCRIGGGTVKPNVFD